MTWLLLSQAFRYHRRLDKARASRGKARASKGLGLGVDAMTLKYASYPKQLTGQRAVMSDFLDGVAKLSAYESYLLTSCSRVATRSKACH